MKHKPKMYDAVSWMLIGMVLCIVGAAFQAGTSTERGETMEKGQLTDFGSTVLALSKDTPTERDSTGLPATDGAH